jgi:hypothetical protein
MILGPLLLAAAAQDALEASTYAQWRDYVLPSAEERVWTEIPWRSTLWEAVRDAHAAERPVLLWAMNGHPQGST